MANKTLERLIEKARKDFDKAKARLESLTEMQIIEDNDIRINKNNIIQWNAYYSGVRDVCNKLLNDEFLMRSVRFEPLILRAKLELVTESLINAKLFMDENYQMMFTPILNRKGKRTGYKASFYETKTLIQKI